MKFQSLLPILLLGILSSANVWSTDRFIGGDPDGNFVFWNRRENIEYTQPSPSQDIIQDLRDRHRRGLRKRPDGDQRQHAQDPLIHGVRRATKATVSALKDAAKATGKAAEAAAKGTKRAIKGAAKTTGEAAGTAAKGTKRAIKGLGKNIARPFKHHHKHTQPKAAEIPHESELIVGDTSPQDALIETYKIPNEIAQLEDQRFNSVHETTIVPEPSQIKSHAPQNDLPPIESPTKKLAATLTMEALQETLPTAIHNIANTLIVKCIGPRPVPFAKQVEALGQTWVSPSLMPTIYSAADKNIPDISTPSPWDYEMIDGRTMAYYFDQQKNSDHSDQIDTHPETENLPASAEPQPIISPIQDSTPILSAAVEDGPLIDAIPSHEKVLNNIQSIADHFETFQGTHNNDSDWSKYGELAHEALTTAANTNAATADALETAQQLHAAGNDAVAHNLTGFALNCLDSGKASLKLLKLVARGIIMGPDRATLDARTAEEWAQFAMPATQTGGAAAPASQPNAAESRAQLSDYAAAGRGVVEFAAQLSDGAQYFMGNTEKIVSSLGEVIQYGTKYLATAMLQTAALDELQFEYQGAIKLTEAGERLHAMIAKFNALPRDTKITKMTTLIMNIATLTATAPLPGVPAIPIAGIQDAVAGIRGAAAATQEAAISHLAGSLGATLPTAAQTSLILGTRDGLALALASETRNAQNILAKAPAALANNPVFAQSLTPIYAMYQDSINILSTGLEVGKDILSRAFKIAESNPELVHTEGSLANAVEKVATEIHHTAHEALTQVPAAAQTDDVFRKFVNISTELRYEKGNFTFQETLTIEEAEAFGKAWVGKGATRINGPKAIGYNSMPISADQATQKTFRIPQKNGLICPKPSGIHKGRIVVNFEEFTQMPDGSVTKIKDGHLIIK